MRYTRTAVMVMLFLAFATLPVPLPALSLDLSSAARSEIAHLLAYMEKPGCQFYRNGTWYGDTKVAREHVERKYHHFAAKGRVASAEDFITWAATKSELSGKPYMVKSGDDAPVPLSQWLTGELGRYRKGAVPPRNE